jgi:hypothetical protein
MLRRLTAASCCAAALCAVPSLAHAQERSVINQYGDHPRYVAELEPHAILGFGYPFDTGQNYLGLGFRASFHITDGFVHSINDSIAIGVGLDFAPGTFGYVLVPVVMQWNFWLSTHWSVFGEPGLAFTNAPIRAIDPVFYAGGRFHFNEHIALTLRVGYPDISVGVSFFL